MFYELMSTGDGLCHKSNYLNEETCLLLKLFCSSDLSRAFCCWSKPWTLTERKQETEPQTRAVFTLSERCDVISPRMRFGLFQQQRPSSLL